MIDKPNRARQTRLLVRLLVAFAVVLCAADSHADEREKVRFLSVGLGTETGLADKKLREYLTERVDLELPLEVLEYEQVVRRLAGWDPEDGLVIARTTPYVLVASEMLGADLEILATYESKATGNTTYQSYYVVRKGVLEPDATPDDVISYIRNAPKRTRVRFRYHNTLSTSSFFLPSLHLRSRRVFNMPAAIGSMAAIDASKAATDSSSDLVRMVGSEAEEERADLVAVWTGTRAGFLDAEAGTEDAAIAARVQFVALPDYLPNDLLVCSRSAPLSLKDALRRAIGEMKKDQIGIGDFSRWVDVRKAGEARHALASLRQKAREHMPPVTVDVVAGSGLPGVTEIMADAARDAIRLSGTELVLFDPDFHVHRDTIWTLDEIHDGAARLTTTLNGPDPGIENQVFPISFRDADDLTGRIVDIVQSQLHRIRYVWPYSGGRLMVLRDSTLPLAPGVTVPVQRITWLDPDANEVALGPTSNVTVLDSTLFVHELDAHEFRTSETGTTYLDPLSNVSYRVYLKRETPKNTWYRVATGALVVLLALAAISAGFAVRRRKRTVQQAAQGGDAA